MTRPVSFLTNNINAILLTVIIVLLSYINNQNRMALDKLIDNTQLLRESDIKQESMIVLNKHDIQEIESDIKKLQSKYYNSNNLLTGKK